MSNQTGNPTTAVMSTVEQVTSTFMTLLYTNAASTGNSTVPFNFDDIIEANDLMSRANYVYAFCMVLALASAGFLLYGFINTYRAQRELALVDSVLLAFSVSQLLLLLLSLSTVAHRPRYLVTTGLGCATLSFSVNTVSLSGMLLLVLLGYMLTVDATSHPVLGRPAMCVGLVVLASAISSVLLAALRGPGQGLEEMGVCVIDPVDAGRSYINAKLCVAFLIPYILLLVLLIGGFVHQWKSTSRFLSDAEEWSVLLAISVATFACQVFYFVVLLKGVGLAETTPPGHRDRALLCVAELVMFSGSCLCLLLVLLLHRSSREDLLRSGRQLRDCCRSLGGRKTHSQMIAPQIEIGSDTGIHFDSIVQ